MKDKKVETMASAPDPVNQAFMSRLGNIFKARFPLIFLRTMEEDRAQAMIRDIARNAALIKTPRRLYTWNVLTGLACENMPDHPDSQEPLKALALIENIDEPAIFLIHDFHEFCDARPDGTVGNPQVVRKLRMLAQNMGQSTNPQNIVLLSHRMQLPQELERDTHMLDLHLPTTEEIRRVLRDIIEANRASGRIQFNLSPQEEERLVKAALGLTLKEAENAFAYAMVEDGQLSVADVNIILEEKCQALKKSDILEVVRSDIQIEDVGGLENLKHWLQKRRNAWMDEARKYALPVPRGILLTGVPGCGKSLLAKAVSSAWQLPLLRLDPGRLYSGLMGSSEGNMRQAIQITEAIAPCVLWIDEIEKGFSQTSGYGDSGTSNRVFGSFLTWLQEKTQPVFVIATANNIEALPPELLRKGRFDEIFFVDLPNRAECMNILYLHLKKRLKDPSVIGDFRLDRPTLEMLAARMKGFNGAEIEQVVVTALYEAFAEQRAIRLSDLEEAIRTTVPLVITQAEHITALRDWARQRAVYASRQDETAVAAVPKRD
jgi:ATP-dependent 26S proteasome regulatory subunit